MRALTSIYSEPKNKYNAYVVGLCRRSPVPGDFYSTNYADFVAFFRIHMCGIRPWSVLSGKVSCRPRLVSHVSCTPLTPLAPAGDATQAVKDATKLADETAVCTCEQQVLAYEEALFPLYLHSVVWCR